MNANQCSDFLRPSQTTHGNTGNHLLTTSSDMLVTIFVSRYPGETVDRHVRASKGFSEDAFCYLKAAWDGGDVDDPAPAAFEHAVDEWP